MGFDGVLQDYIHSTWIVTLVLVAMGCGGSDDGATRLSFPLQGELCAQPGLLAYLQVTGVPGICPLEVGADRTVSGRCDGVPTGQIRELRLVYYIQADGREVRLAQATTQLDLRNQTDAQVDVVFEADDLITSFDEDEDGRSNLLEFCEGTDPLATD